MSLTDLISRSLELAARLSAYEALTPYDTSPRIGASWTMCSVSMEHSESSRLLVEKGNFTSAVAVVRLQFEALVRALWLLDSASDHGAKKAADGLSSHASGKNERIPMLAEMLKKLRTSAPSAVVDQLMDLHDKTWKPLSSYVHGGAHAMERHRNGYPGRLLAQVLAASNGMSMMSAQLLIVLSGQGAHSRDLVELQHHFADCLPEMHSHAT